MQNRERTAPPSLTRMHKTAQRQQFYSYGLQDSEDEADADEAPKKKRSVRTPKELKSPQTEKAPKLARAGRRFSAAELKARAEKRELTAIEVGVGYKRCITVTLVSSPPLHRRWPAHQTKACGSRGRPNLQVVTIGSGLILP